jgi:hypothetical protein
MTPYYEDEAVQLWHGDARVVLPTLQPVDLLLTDPPYGIDVARRGTIGTSKAGRVKDYGASDWDSKPPARWLLEQARSLAAWSVIFGGNYFELPPARCWLVWDKDTRATLRTVSWRGLISTRLCGASRIAGTGCCRSLDTRKSSASTRRKSQKRSCRGRWAKRRQLFAR